MRKENNKVMQDNLNNRDQKSVVNFIPNMELSYLADLFINELMNSLNEKVGEKDNGDVIILKEILDPDSEMFSGDLSLLMKMKRYYWEYGFIAGSRVQQRINRVENDKMKIKEMETMEKEYNRFKSARIIAGFTCNQVADIINVSVKTIYNWESGKRNPNKDALIKLATLYGTTTDYLLG